MHFSMKKDDFQNVYIFEKWTTILGGNAVTPLEKEKKMFLNKSHKDPWMEPNALHKSPKDPKHNQTERWATSFIK